MTAGCPWFERFPELQAWELERFAHHNLPVEIDQGRLDRGQFVVTTSLWFRGEPVATTVAYPSEYPELPPIVYGPRGLLNRHQHQFGGNFCLLERPLDDWNAASWGAADLIAHQLVRLFADTEAGAEAVARNEAPMPEPASAYFNYAPDAAVIVPGELATPDGTSGDLRVGRVTPHLHILTAVGEQRGDAVAHVLPVAETIEGRWLRLHAPPIVGDGDGQSLASWIREHHPDALAKKFPHAWVKKGRAPALPSIEIVGLVFGEEGPDVGETRDAWIFVALDRRQGPERAFLLHAQVLSPIERQRRTPELEGLAEKRVVVLGAGSLGGDVAIEIARAGAGQIEIVDHDRFEATNSVRHPLGIDYVGLPKATAVALACQRANPFCQTRFHRVRFGADDWIPGAAPADVLAELLATADLVIEATGSHQIAQFAARLAAEAGVPIVAGWMTDGFYGAEIVRIRPGQTMCWTCFVTAQRTGRLPMADRGSERSVVVQGCTHPTVEGAGFDVAECAAALTRMAVATLAPVGGYPDHPYDYAAISFRCAPDDPDKPRLAVAKLAAQDEGCAQCQPAVGLTATPTTS